MLELSPPLPILLLPRVGGLSALSTRAVGREDIFKPTIDNESLYEISNDNGVRQTNGLDFTVTTTHMK
jgi:hypothetical protein